MVAVVAATADVRGAIGFSSFGVLVYYAIANASAWTLEFPMACGGRLGLAGCLVLAFALPLSRSLRCCRGAAVVGARRTRCWRDAERRG